MYHTEFMELGWSINQKHLYFCKAIQLSQVPRVSSGIFSRLLRRIHSSVASPTWAEPFGADSFGPDMVPIKLKLYRHRVRGSHWQWLWIAERRFAFPLSEARNPWKKDPFKDVIFGYLMSLRIPELLYPPIIAKIYDLIEVAVPENPIIVTIVQVPKKNATTSSVKDFERVTPDSFEQANTCSICWDDFDSDEETTVRLPCLHRYHADCVVPWLEWSEECPLCRRPTPISRVIAPKLSCRATWPKYLLISAGVLITAKLVCRLCKRKN